MMNGAKLPGGEKRPMEPLRETGNSSGAGMKAGLIIV